MDLKILNRLGNEPGVAPGILRPIDTKRIAHDLGLVKEAVENGRRNVPAANADMLSSIEQRIIQLIEGEWIWHGGVLINNLRAYASRLIGYSIDAEFTKLQIQANDALAQLRSANHRAEADLGPLREAFLAARQDLDRFRARHRLERTPRDPTRRWTAFGLLFVMIAVESVLNGFFFAKGSAFGLVGGVGTAIGISLANVAFAFLLGLGPARWMHFRNIVLKLVGFIFTAAGLASLIALHAFAAHLRDATAAVGEERAMTVAIDSLLRSPWTVADLSSIYLFGLGTLFGLTAFWKGYRFDDPFPGYGAHTRRAATAREDYSNDHAALFDDLAQIKDLTLRALADGIDRIPLFPQQAANIQAQRAAALQTFKGYEADVVTAANQLLAQYRDANRTIRTEPAPAYFERPWQLRHSILEGPEVKTLTAQATPPATDVQTALKELSRLSQEILDEYEALLTKYPHPTQMV